MTPIYLDHNATTPMLPEVADAVHDASLRYAANPASQHESGRQARRAIEAARDRIGEILGATPGDLVVFTSGGTEANNLALTGLLRPAELPGAGAPGAETKPDERPWLVISALEHPSIARAAEQLAALGVEVRVLGANVDGVVRVDQLEAILPPPLAVGGKRAPGSPPALPAPQRRALVSVMLASNETGVIQPVAEISRLSGRRGILVHTDATQAVGKIPVNFHELDVEALTATAHKFHGPHGIGVLLVRQGIHLEPALRGGFQQQGLRPGTESVALVVGMLRALEVYEREAAGRTARLTALRDRFEQLLAAGEPRAVVLGGAAARLPHTSNVAFLGLDRQALAMALDLAGVACSTGSACASGSSEPSPALVAMGLADEEISSSLRFSCGATTTPAEIDEAARRILAVVNRLRRQ